MRIIYGKHPVYEALQNESIALEMVYLKLGLMDASVDHILKCCKDRSIPFRWMEDRFFAKQARGRNHQGVIASIKELDVPVYENLHAFWEEEQPTAPYILLALDQITDVHNMGAILRSATFFRVGGVIFESKNSANLSEVAHKTSSGAIGKIPLIRVDNLATVLREAKTHLFKLIATSSTEGIPIHKSRIDQAKDQNLILILGSEGKGIRKKIMELADSIYMIERRGDMDSLNVSVAAGIFLSYLTDQLDA